MLARPRQRLGQHFLHDPVVIGKIINAIAPGWEETIVEIGGGRGALTRPLLERVKHVHVIEIDRALAEQLRGLADERRLTVHVADALQFDFSVLAQTPCELRIVGNLPYNVSTPLLFHLLEHRAAIADMHLMLQKEVVDRMLAVPGTKDYGRLTVMLSAWTVLTRCFDVGPGAFTPPPRVWSSVVRVVPLTAPRFPIPDERRFAEVVAHAFSMRRKTLARSFRGWLSREQIASLGIDPGARAETLAASDFARLAALARDDNAKPRAD